MEQRATQYLVGIGGWEHEVLGHCFYPRGGARQEEKLAWYAQSLDTVEVRPTFWDDTLTAADARRWIDSVAGANPFRFSVKLHSSFTHKRTIRAHLTRSTRGILQELEKCNRLGALLAQFPYAFTNTSAHRFHLEKIGELFRGFPVYAELRHESWHQRETIEFLAENSLYPVSIDLPRIRQYMPFGTGVVGDSAYLRLHGRNEKGWLLNGLDARYDYLYNHREIREIVRRLELLSHGIRRVTVIFNNTTGGKAIANALQLKSALRGGKPIAVPRPSIDAFPHLQDIARPEDAASLFKGTEYREAM